MILVPAPTLPTWSICHVGHDAPSADEALFVGAQPLHPDQAASEEVVGGSPAP